MDFIIVYTIFYLNSCPDNVETVHQNEKATVELSFFYS